MTPAPPRPRDADQTRARILAAARHEFTRTGYGGVTVRSIAARAEVAPNLITRYFGGKQGLFAEVADVHLDVDAMFDGPRETLGARMAEAIVRRWTTLGGDDPLLALMRAAGDHPSAAAALTEVLDRESLRPLQARLEAEGFAPADAAARARSIDVFLVGVTARLRMLADEPIDPDALRDLIATAVQRLVDAA